MSDAANIERELFDVPSAARRLSVGRRTVWALVGSGDLESVRIGNRRLIPRAAIDAYVAQLRAKQSGNGHAAHKRTRTPRTRTTTAAARPARQNPKASGS